MHFPLGDLSQTENEVDVARDRDELAQPTLP